MYSFFLFVCLVCTYSALPFSLQRSLHAEGKEQRQEVDDSTRSLLDVDLIQSRTANPLDLLAFLLLGFGPRLHFGRRGLAPHNVGRRQARIPMKAKIVHHDADYIDGIQAQPHRIAVVGGGLAGLATAVNLLSEANSSLHRLDIYDAKPPGEGGASAVAAGLLHPFTRQAREIWQGLAGYDATVALLHRVEQKVGPCSRKSGLLRIALNEKRASELRSDEIKNQDHDVLVQHWLTHDQTCQHADVSVGGAGSLHSPSAVSINVPAYLRGLWHLCGSIARERGTSIEWKIGELTSLSKLSCDCDYDAIVVALGAKTIAINGLEDLPLKPCRGQNLIFSNKAGLKIPIISGKYVVPLDDEGKLLAGATFEYDHADIVDRPADVEMAKSILEEPLSELLPHIMMEELLCAQAGVRARPPRSHFGYVPLAGRVGEGNSSKADCWFLGGFGSRGLIHHALLGRAMALAVLHRDGAFLPEHTRRKQTALDSVTLATHS